MKIPPVDHIAGVAGWLFVASLASAVTLHESGRRLEAADGSSGTDAAAEPAKSGAAGTGAAQRGTADTTSTRIELTSGAEVSGDVLKRTDAFVYVDLGFTVLAVPQKDIARIVQSAPPSGPPSGERPRDADSTGHPVSEAPPAGRNPDPSAEPKESSGGAGSPNGPGKRESIYFTRDDLPAGPVDEKAREVAEGVVKILCAGGQGVPAKSGSGFVIDEKEGYIVTNYHVIEREQHVSIIVYSRTETGLERVRKDAIRIVAFNPYFDLALLKLEDFEGVNLRKVYIGDYESVQLGDPVFAIGSPLGLERSVSQGIVSNRNRASGGLVFIQTTAAINPGNSGGALFNRRGEVIGVTNMKIQGFGVESVGFAIPAHHLKDFLRHYQAFAYDKDNPNSGIRYLQPPRKPKRKLSRPAPVSE